MNIYLLPHATIVATPPLNCEDWHKRYTYEVVRPLSDPSWHGRRFSWHRTLEDAQAALDAYNRTAAA